MGEERERERLREIEREETYCYLCMVNNPTYILVGLKTQSPLWETACFTRICKDNLLVLYSSLTV
jgi:hypothetical protein